MGIECNALDAESAYKREITKTLEALNECESEILKSLEQENQIATVHAGLQDTKYNFDHTKIKQFILELSQYINDNDFFDPF